MARKEETVVTLEGERAAALRLRRLSLAARR